MKQRIAVLLLVLSVVGVVRFAFFAAERRAARASNMLRKELSTLHEAPAPRVPHVTSPVPGSTAELFRGLFTGAAPDAGRILDATHAAAGGLPDGLAAGTAGADSWDGVSRAESSVVTAIDGLPRCLDALALGRDLAVGGGLEGITAAHRLTGAAFATCARLLDGATRDEKLAAAGALKTTLDSAPSLPIAFREADLDRQLRTFGRWMRPEDLDRLPKPSRALADAARDLPGGFITRQRLLGAWSGMTKNAREAGDALALAEKPRTERLAWLEASLESAPARDVGLRAGWRDGLRAHEERLAVLRLLRLAAQLDADRAAIGAWRKLGELESSEVDVKPAGEALELTLHGTSYTLTLHPDAR